MLFSQGFRVTEASKIVPFFRSQALQAVFSFLPWNVLMELKGIEGVAICCEKKTRKSHLSVIPNASGASGKPYQTIFGPEWVEKLNR